MLVLAALPRGAYFELFVVVGQLGWGSPTGGFVPSLGQFPVQ